MSKDAKYYIRGLQKLEWLLNAVDKGIGDYIESKEDIETEMANEPHEPTEEELEIYNKSIEQLYDIYRKIQKVLPYNKL